MEAVTSAAKAGGTCPEQKVCIELHMRSQEQTSWVSKAFWYKSMSRQHAQDVFIEVIVAGSIRAEPATRTSMEGEIKKQA